MVITSLSYYSYSWFSLFSFLSLPRIISSRRPPRSVGSRGHVHLEVHRLNAVKTLLAVARPKHKGRHKERLCDHELCPGVQVSPAELERALSSDFEPDKKNKEGSTIPILDNALKHTEPNTGNGPSIFCAHFQTNL